MVELKPVKLNVPDIFFVVVSYCVIVNVPTDTLVLGLKEVKEIAKENDIYLCIAYVSMPELLEGEHKEFMGYMELSDEEEEGRNVALFIDNRGEVNL